MFIMKLKSTIFSLAALAVAGLSANGATVVTSYSTVTGADDNNQAGPMFGQSITVNVGADTADGSIPATVYLTELSFQYSSSASGGTLSNAYIHVYDAFAVDGDNTPSTIGNLVAVSTSTVSSGAANGTLTWTFGGDAISKSTAYTYVFASTTTAQTVADSSGLVGAGIELNTGNPYTGGRAFRANGTTTDWDFAFEMKTSTTPVPEPSAALLGGLGLLALLRRRRA